MQIDLQRRVRAWAPRRADIAAWATAALGRRAANAELSVRLVGRAEGRRLNARYRGKDYATNVLSFPASLVVVVGFMVVGIIVGFIGLALPASSKPEMFVTWLFFVAAGYIQWFVVFPKLWRWSRNRRKHGT